jgi:hypothetical protein
MMIRRLAPLVVIVGLVFPAMLLSAEEKYTIKVKESGPGTRSLHESTTTDEANTKITDPDGKVLQDKNDKRVTTQKYTETVLERAKGKRPTRLRRAYEKFEIKVGDDTTSPSFAGKTVVIEKQKDGKYHFTIEGGDELKGKDAEPLEKEFNRNPKSDEDPAAMVKLLLPATAVGIDETWKIDAKKFAELLSLDGVPVDPTKAEGNGKLVKAYKKDGHQFGVLEYQIAMPLKGEFGSGDKKIPIQPGSNVVAQIKIDACIDASVDTGIADFRFDIKLFSTLKANDMELKLNVTTRSTEHKSDTELPAEKK